MPPRATPQKNKTLSHGERVARRRAKPDCLALYHGERVAAHRGRVRGIWHGTLAPPVIPGIAWNLLLTSSSATLLATDKALLSVGLFASEQTHGQSATDRGCPLK